MKLFDNVYSENDLAKFIEKSNPAETSNFRLYKGEEDAGLVTLFFKNSEIMFEVLISLAIDDLTRLVIFFENIINLKEDSAIFLENEEISTPLLYASPIGNEKIRFLVADGKKVHRLWYEDKISNEQIEKEGIWSYEIRCDVIIDKKILLKDFYRVIKNIINTFIVDENYIYDINYISWKDSLKNIISYLKYHNF